MDRLIDTLLDNLSSLREDQLMWLSAGKTERLNQLLAYWEVRTRVRTEELNYTRPNDTRGCSSGGASEPSAQQTRSIRDNET